MLQGSCGVTFGQLLYLVKLDTPEQLIVVHTKVASVVDISKGD